MSTLAFFKRLPEGLLQTMAFAILIIGVIATVAVISSHRYSTVVGARPVGFAENAQYSSDFTSNYTRVETDKGVFRVGGTFQIEKGNPMIVEERLNGDRWLCDAVATQCKKLID